MQNKKTITEQKFIELIKNAEIVSGFADAGDYQEEEWDDEGEIDYIDYVWGYAWNTLDLGDLGEIVYQNSYSHVADKPSTIEFNERGDYCGYNFENFNAIVVDEDGDEIDRDELEKHLKFETKIEYVEIEGEDEIIDMTTGDAQMETIIVERDKDLDIKFNGERVAKVESSMESVCSNYSGNFGYCIELNLYKISGGKFVCEKIEYTRVQGQHTRYYGAICNDETEVIQYFGTGWLAKVLYKNAGIEAVEIVD